MFDLVIVLDAWMLQIGVSRSSDTPGRNLQHPRCCEGIDSLSFPPGDFVAEAMPCDTAWETSDRSPVQEGQASPDYGTWVRSDIPRRSAR